MAHLRDLGAAAETLALLGPVRRQGARWFVGSQAFRVVALESDSVASLRRVERSPTDRTPPLIVVPYMGSTGRSWCREEGLSWIDLSGNAHVENGVHLHIEGRPNRFPKRGRPSTVFATKGSRLVRALLMEPDRCWRQVDLAENAELSPGYVSKVMRRLRTAAHVVKEGRLWSLRDPARLLEAWASRYDFARHEVLQGHRVSADSSEATQAIHDTLSMAGVTHAATGLTGAWLRTRFAAHRLTTFYLEHTPSDELLVELGVRETDRGPNVWLVVPNDPVVFSGVTDAEGIPCVHPIQLYLDLGSHPERAPEARERVREECLGW